VSERKVPASPPVAADAAQPCPEESDRLSEENRETVVRHRELLDRARLVLVDLDGCLVFGSKPHPAAREFLKRYKDRCAILSNNSSETPESLARLLASKGLVIDSSRILLAGSLMIDLLAVQHRESRICLLASPTIRSYAAASGLRLSRRSAMIVALARDTTLTYAKLMQTVACLHGGAGLVVSNTDLTHPGRNRLPVPETGSILRLIEACVPGLPFTVIGKPSPTMFDIALDRFDTDAASAVMIGDNPSTDGAGAERAGIAPILVGPAQQYASIADLL
jgi:HAD superfamily hydrolase (TIGR01450 family)